jgi:hypothetical protein
MRSPRLLEFGRHLVDDLLRVPMLQSAIVVDDGAEVGEVDGRTKRVEVEALGSLFGRRHIFERCFSQLDNRWNKALWPVFFFLQKTFGFVSAKLFSRQESDVMMYIRRSQQNKNMQDQNKVMHFA